MSARSAARRSGSTSRTPRTRRTPPPRASAQAEALEVNDPVDELTFGTPQPQPGGTKREYWIQACEIDWSVVPTGRDDWHGHKITGRKRFRALVYQLMKPGFSGVAGPVEMPGPTLEAEVGDTLVVHFRNATKQLNQALTMHPHGVKYTPDYDGVYLGDHTRVGGFIAPGEEFTYTWEATPDSVGVWPYHDHGPNHTMNTFRGLFGAIIVRERGAKRPDVEQVLFLHSLCRPRPGSRARSSASTGARSPATRRRSPRAPARTSRST